MRQATETITKVQQILNMDIGDSSQCETPQTTTKRASPLAFKQSVRATFAEPVVKTNVAKANPT